MTSVKSFIGADVRVESFSFYKPLDDTQLRGYATLQRDRGIVADFAFQTFGLNDYPFIQQTELTSLVEFPTQVPCHVHVCARPSRSH